MSAKKKLITIAIIFLFSFLSGLGLALPAGKPSQVSSNSVLVALLDSPYSEFAELVEKALLLHALEQAVSKHNITVFAPKNEALEMEIDPEFKRFLVQPGNVMSLQALLLHHVVPVRLGRNEFPTELTRLEPLSGDPIAVSRSGDVYYVDAMEITRPDSVIRPDGIIHGINKVLVPKSVQQAFNARRSLSSISAVKPEGAPVIDPRTLKRKAALTPPLPTVSPPPPPHFPIYSAMASEPATELDGESQVKDFVHTLLHFGGYNEMADILVNLTNLAAEMGKLVNAGYTLTVLAPNDEAMAKLTAEQLSVPDAPEQMIYYHIVPEYQTEESMYNAVRRFGKVKYETLRLPHKIVARESDGSVKFGDGENSAYLLDPDIYTDGRISVQGIDGVLFPEKKTKNQKDVKTGSRKVKVSSAKSRRGTVRIFYFFFRK